MLAGSDGRRCCSREEETFGPVAPVFRFATEAGGDRARERHGVRARRLLLQPATSRASGGSAEQLEFGIVGVNTGVFSYEGAPFGGFKESGLGREGSQHGIDEFLELKYLCLDGLDADR